MLPDAHSSDSGASAASDCYTVEEPADNYVEAVPHQQGSVTSASSSAPNAVRKPCLTGVCACAGSGGVYRALEMFLHASAWLLQRCDGRPVMLHLNRTCSVHGGHQPCTVCLHDVHRQVLDVLTECRSASQRRPMRNALLQSCSQMRSSMW